MTYGQTVRSRESLKSNLRPKAIGRSSMHIGMAKYKFSVFICSGRFVNFEVRSVNHFFYAFFFEGNAKGTAIFLTKIKKLFLVYRSIGHLNTPTYSTRPEVRSIENEVE